MGKGRNFMGEPFGLVGITLRQLVEMSRSESTSRSKSRKTTDRTTHDVQISSHFAWLIKNIPL
jgi:hypothetical protein